MVQGVTAYKTDPAWISWLALVEHETAASSDAFTPESIERLDDLRIKHWKAFKAVPQYAACTKPKHLLRANYPDDIKCTGPLIRTWCMSFEALLQVLKLICHNSNYRNVCERLVRIWAIRNALVLHHDSLSRWSDDNVYLTSEPATATFKDYTLLTITGPRMFGALGEFELSVRTATRHARTRARYTPATHTHAPCSLCATCPCNGRVACTLVSRLRYTPCRVCATRRATRLATRRVASAAVLTRTLRARYAHATRLLITGHPLQSFAGWDR